MANHRTIDSRVIRPEHPSQIVAGVITPCSGRHCSEHPQNTFTCPQCGMTSHNPNDVREGYCGNCHTWTGKGYR